MPIPASTKLKIRPALRTVSFEKELKSNGEEWMAWWYCGIYKNQRAKSQPNVLIAFREIISGKFNLKQVPLTALGQITVGSIWKDGICQSEVDFTAEDFSDLDFGEDGWRFTSFYTTFNNGTDTPYPFDIHPLQYKTDRNSLIEFKLPSGGKLLVPCLEFFSRCYGRSQELNRVLATFPWSGNEDSCLSKLYAALDEPEEPDVVWKVKLKTRLRNGDTTLLAHAKYDPYTQAKVKSIYAQIEDNFVPESKLPIFITVAPWFQGPAELRARGIWFDNNRSFLALQIVGGSDPDGILISRNRENSNKRTGQDPNGIGGEAWPGAHGKTIVRPPDIVDLTANAEPDQGSNTVEVLDQNFVTMGIPRAIVDRYGNKVTNRSGRRRKGDDVSTYSSGDPQGSGKGVGYASIHAKPIMDLHGTLIDMWNAMLLIQRKYPSKIQRVEWFTFEDAYKTVGPPRLIALDPFDEEDDIDLPTATRNWLYHDVAMARVRGVMVARLIIGNVSVFIIELQRRPRNIKDKNEQVTSGEESFKGCVIALEDCSQFGRWLKRFLSDVRYVRGIVQKLMPHAIGTADTFVHKPPEQSESSVLHALSKVGIIL